MSFKVLIAMMVAVVVFGVGGVNVSGGQQPSGEELLIPSIKDSVGEVVAAIDNFSEVLKEEKDRVKLLVEKISYLKSLVKREDPPYVIAQVLWREIDPILKAYRDAIEGDENDAPSLVEIYTQDMRASTDKILSRGDELVQRLQELLARDTRRCLGHCANVYNAIKNVRNSDRDLLNDINNSRGSLASLFEARDKLWSLVFGGWTKKALMQTTTEFLGRAEKGQKLIAQMVGSRGRFKDVLQALKSTVSRIKIFVLNEKLEADVSTGFPPVNKGSLETATSTKVLIYDQGGRVVAETSFSASTRAAVLEFAEDKALRLANGVYLVRIGSRLNKMVILDGKVHMSQQLTQQHIPYKMVSLSQTGNGLTVSLTSSKKKLRLNEDVLLTVSSAVGQKLRTVIAAMPCDGVIPLNVHYKIELFKGDPVKISELAFQRSITCTPLPIRRWRPRDPIYDISFEDGAKKRIVTENVSDLLKFFDVNKKIAVNGNMIWGQGQDWPHRSLFQEWLLFARLAVQVELRGNNLLSLTGESKGVKIVVFRK